MVFTASLKAIPGVERNHRAAVGRMQINSIQSLRALQKLRSRFHDDVILVQ